MSKKYISPVVTVVDFDDEVVMAAFSPPEGAPQSISEEEAWALNYMQQNQNNN